MLGRRRIRIAIGVFILAAVWNLTWTRATSYVSTQAVIDAPLVTVRAPADGTILVASPGLGSGVEAETTLLQLAPRDMSPQDLIWVQGDIFAARTEIDALSDEIAATGELVSQLEARATAERESEIRYLTQRLLEMREIREQHGIRWDRASENLERLRNLSETAGVAKVKIRDAELDLELADAMIAEADARVAAVRTELEAIEAGLPSPAGTGRRDAAYDRLDDLRIHLNDLKTRRSIAAGRRAGLELRLTQTDSASDRLARFEPKAATSGVIWTASPPIGASAARGASLTEVLDCRRRFVEVVLSERIFEQLQVGTQATVRLKGSEASFVARVAFQRAAGEGTALSGTYAPPEVGSSGYGLRVYLALPPAEITDASVAARFCDVGRTAEVTIPRPGVSERLAAMSALLDRLAARTLSVAGALMLRETG